MEHLHWEFDVVATDTIEVTLDRQANVRLLDASNYAQHQRGGTYQHHGGLAKQSPVRLSPPRAGRWHLVVDLAGYSGTVRAGARLLQRSV